MIAYLLFSILCVLLIPFGGLWLWLIVTALVIVLQFLEGGVKALAWIVRTITK